MAADSRDSDAYAEIRRIVAESRVIASRERAERGWQLSLPLERGKPHSGRRGAE